MKYILPPPQLEISWQEALKNEWNKSYLIDLIDFLAEERASSIPIYPPASQVFNAFFLAPFDQVKVVIVGQDPYHNPGQAHGLSFSVPKGIPLPPSLQNIFKELRNDLEIAISHHGCLESWAKQGILLLNTVLTVQKNKPRSHYGKGWELFTDAVITMLAKREDPLVFVLWGKSAIDKCEKILAQIKNPHYILTAPHPSPYSAHTGFFGCRHFSKINEFLVRNGKTPINWILEDA